MGAWGTRSFENDGALDWLGDFLDRPSDEALRAAFSPTPSPRHQGFLARLFGGRAGPAAIRPNGEHVLAAAEVIAAMRGYPPAEVPLDFTRLPLRVPPDDLVRAAIGGVDSILDESSELHSLWRGTDDFSMMHRDGAMEDEDSREYLAWLAGVRDLRERLIRP
jgi:Domain of unknown function (DUF4259)